MIGTCYIDYGAQGELLFHVTTVLTVYLNTNVRTASRVKVVNQEGNKLLLLLLLLTQDKHHQESKSRPMDPQKVFQKF